MNKQEILNEIEKMENKLAEFKQELTKTKGKWTPKDGEEYWCYDKDIEKTRETSWRNDYYDKTRLKNKVVFITREEAQRYADYQKAKEKYSYEFSKEEWKNTELKKYFIYYENEDKEIDIDYTNYWNYLGITYFKDYNQAQEFIDKHKDEILEFEFGIKEG